MIHTLQNRLGRHSVRGVGRSSGSWSADPQGPGITVFFDGNAAKRATADPYWKNQTPLRREKSSLECLD